MKRDRAATEKKIYDAFISLLEKKGPQGVGINAIAKKAGVSKELIYRYYGGLKGLLLNYAKSGDFFKPLHLVDDKEKSSVEDLKRFTKEGTKELRNNKITQEILRWQLIENKEETKDLFKYTNKQMEKIFAINDRDSSLQHAFHLMIGGYIYFTLSSKFNKKFINADLSSDEMWDKFDKAIEKTLDLFNEE
ncbi:MULTISPECIES: TetR/AcrR family transcriptional regulator [Tenacibaculum]|uniref:TetR/AcrR family transcriptional regulator n=1 Tax=Tenacibaculum aiptasiae TaxID=426481 RepID=A0A7J5A9M6_9FLAO|nr:MULTISPECIES: TetR/AcrR family transcriptional regulator [Tenacibaculum]KAB1154281.1 TetR/AcrR family transcriptional regulator [Tenacibaculum aiptasiae]MCF2876456.1 TetR/AcrR family transcriptional regulator [Tenacibaculum sp. Cn5-1]MCF2936637.1 TetR/AcrR family transcriptional regulator [Tenacibaculum sp. Cn5-34]MCG7511770.1 TetR/AcrR family transcriptional regulator [Tenacibaculum sp. Cn5-46]